jgi:hypothetical protein
MGKIRERKVNYFPFALYLKINSWFKSGWIHSSRSGLTFGYLGILELAKKIFSNIIYCTAHSLLHVSIYYVLYILAVERVILH